MTHLSRSESQIPRPSDLRERLIALRWWWRGFRYRVWSRLLHRFSLHHTRTYGPLEPDGGYLERCEWCGLHRSWGRKGDLR